MGKEDDKWRIIRADTNKEMKLRRADEEEQRLKTKKADKEKEDKKFRA